MLKKQNSAAKDCTVLIKILFILCVYTLPSEFATAQKSINLYK